MWEGWRDVGGGVVEECGGKGGGEFGRVVCGWGR